MAEQTYSLDTIMRALENREFIVYYQPQYNAITNELKSAEALARWRLSDGSIVIPDSFIPVLENGPEIMELDWYILREVCRFLQMQEEKQIHRVPVAVNFSRLHFDGGDFLPKLLETVDGFGVPHRLVEVEITESALSENGDKIISQVKEIRAAGFSVAIDDFGSGLSSLSFVKDMDVDVLKIDKSLLNQNCEDEKERIVLESIFMFAHRLKLKTIAEGVETREQLGFLRTCDCKLIQGFLFSKPLPEDEFLKICAERESAEEAEDILTVQAPSAATQLLLDAVFTRYPLVIFSNLTRNSFYMMAYENFTARTCPSTGVFDELIEHGTATMHPDDQDAFRQTFDRHNLLKAYENGEKWVSLTTKQIGNDGVYRRVETTDYFVKNPSADDVLVISLCHNLE